MFDIKQATSKLLNGCIIEADNGVKLFTPDGTGFYAALWTRDFSYMVEYSGDLIGLDAIKQNIEYSMKGMDSNGWVPDRVNKDGTAKYTAGGDDFPALPNLDNGPFLVITANAYLDRIGMKDAKKLYMEWDNQLCAGLLCLPVNENYIIENLGETLHSPYGFHDCVMKSGLLSFETLLLWRALKYICKWKTLCGLNTDKFDFMVKQIENSFCDIFSSAEGMLYSATGIGHQIDIWASCYAVSIGFPLSDKQKKQIASWLIENKQKYVYCGQIRQLPKPEYWDKLFVDIRHDFYQNGGYWSVATGWVYDAVKNVDPKFAVTIISDVLKYFEENGIFECVYGDQKKLASYVVSASCVYGVFDEFLKLKEQLA